MNKAMKTKLNNFKKYCVNHKTQIAIAGVIAGYSALWFAAGRKFGYADGLKEGFSLGSKEGACRGIIMGDEHFKDFLKEYVPGAFALLEEWTKNNPESEIADGEFVQRVLCDYSNMFD